MPDFANPNEARASLAELRVRAAAAAPAEREALERRAEVMEAIIAAWEDQVRAVGAPWDTRAGGQPAIEQPSTEQPAGRDGERRRRGARWRRR